MGRHAKDKGSLVCDACSSPFTTVSANATSCDVCDKEFYMDLEGACQACPDRVTCNKAETLKSLKLEPGWYRHTPLSGVVYKCKIAESCK